MSFNAFIHCFVTLLKHGMLHNIVNFILLSVNYLGAAHTPYVGRPTTHVPSSSLRSCTTLCAVNSGIAF